MAKVTILDKWLGEMPAPGTLTGALKGQMRLLVTMKNANPRHSARLEEDIAACQTVLDSPEPDRLAEHYFDIKDRDWSMRPASVVRVLQQSGRL